MLIKVLLFFCYCFSSKSILLSLAPFSLGQAIQINLANKRKQGRASGEEPKSKRRKKHKDLDSKKKSTKSDKKLIQSNKEKTHQCDVCKNMFTTKQTLIFHKQTQHTQESDNKERPFKCDLCPIRCSQEGHLVIHKRIHTGEKPFKCDVCDKAFAREAALKIHKRTHTGEKPYPCEVCKRKFTSSTALNTHKRTHTGEKPYPCEVCHERFSQKSNCNRHKKRKHKKESDVPQEETQAEQEANSTRMEDTSEWNVEKIAECLAHCNQENPFSFECSNNFLGKEA